MTQIKKIRNNINKSAPVWMQQVMGVLLLLLSCKDVLIDQMPGLEVATKILIGDWLGWIVKSFGVAISLVAMFSQKKEGI